MRDHREDVAGVGIDRDQRAGPVAHRLLGRLLHVEVEAQHHALPGNLGNLAQQLEPAANRIDLDLLAPGLAAQLAFEYALEAEFSDLVAHPIVVGVAEIALGDLADVAEQMRRDAAHRCNGAAASPRD